MLVFGVVVSEGSCGEGGNGEVECSFEEVGDDGGFSGLMLAWIM